MNYALLGIDAGFKYFDEKFKYFDEKSPEPQRFKYFDVKSPAPQTLNTKYSTLNPKH